MVALGIPHAETRKLPKGRDLTKFSTQVAGTITAHHLWMTIDDWCGDVFSFCKPVAKVHVLFCRLLSLYFSTTLDVHTQSSILSSMLISH